MSGWRRIDPSYIEVNSRDEVSTRVSGWVKESTTAMMSVPRAIATGCTLRLTRCQLSALTSLEVSTETDVTESAQADE